MTKIRLLLQGRERFKFFFYSHSAKKSFKVADMLEQNKKRKD